MNDSSSSVSDNGTDPFDIFTYLQDVLGPQRQPPEKLIPLTIVYIGMRC